MVRGEGGAARRDGDGHAGLVEADDVRVALADDDPVGLDDVALGPAQPVQHPGLAVDLGLRRVLVLGGVRAARQDPPAEGDRLAGLVEDREEQAGPEGVLQPVAPVEEGQPALPQRPLRPGQAGDERVPVVGRPTEPEPAGDGPVDAAAAQVVPGGPPVGRGEQALVVPLDGRLDGLEQLLAAAAVPALAPGRVPERDPGLPGQLLDGDHEVDVLDVLHEAEHVARGAAAEAVVAADLVADVERARPLGVEGAQPDVVATDPLELHVRGHHVDQRNRGPHPLDVLLDDRHGPLDTTGDPSAPSGAFSAPGTAVEAPRRNGSCPGAARPAARPAPRSRAR